LPAYSVIASECEAIHARERKSQSFVYIKFYSQLTFKILLRARNGEAVIARNEMTKQTSLFKERKAGLPRCCAPRNDGERKKATLCQLARLLLLYHHG
jgi:hypothetical protein